MKTAPLINTPVIYFTCGQLLGLSFYVFQNPNRMQERKSQFLYLLFSAVYLLFGYLTRERGFYTFWPVYLCQVLIGSTMLYYLCRIPYLNAIYFCLRGFLLGETATSIQWQLNHFQLNYLPKSLPAIWVAVSIYAIVIILAWIFEHPHMEENGALPLHTKQLARMIFLYLFTLSFANAGYLPLITPLQVSSSEDLFQIRSVAYLGGLGISAMFHSQLLEMERRINAEKLQAITRLQYNNYKINESNIALVNQKYHDLKHQIHWLRDNTHSEEKRKALDAMEEEIQVYELRVNTDNKVLDAILTAAAQSAWEQKIQLHCFVDGKAVEFMSSIDISTLFGNALDNAIEAVRQVEDPNGRIIDVIVSRKNNFTSICVRNPYVGNLKMHNGFPLTTKSNTDDHGFGVRSIQSIVAKYDGSVSVHHDGGIFELRILFSSTE